MGLSTFTELKSAIADWLVRDDLTAAIPSFIALAEADISRILRDNRMQKRSTATLDAQYSALPSDWIETIRLHLTDSTHRIELVSAGALADLRAERGDTSGRPTHYAITANGLELFPTPDAAYAAELVYYAKVPSLSDAAPTNWLLTNAPDVLLYGALSHSAPYLKDDSRISVWSGLYQSAINNLNTASERARFSGSGLRLRNRGMA